MWSILWLQWRRSYIFEEVLNSNNFELVLRFCKAKLKKNPQNANFLKWNYRKLYGELLGPLKVTVQFETEGNGQNEIVSNIDRSEVKLLISEKKYCGISSTERDFETEKFDRKWVWKGAKTFKSVFLESIFMSKLWDTRSFNSSSFSLFGLKLGSFIGK